MNDFSYKADAQQRFVDEKDKIAQRLRDLAGHVDGIATHTPDGTKLRNPSATVSEITHTVLWGVANLRLDRLSSWADDVYKAEQYDRESK